MLVHRCELTVRLKQHVKNHIGNVHRNKFKVSEEQSTDKVTVVFGILYRPSLIQEK